MPPIMLPVTDLFAPRAPIDSCTGSSGSPTLAMVPPTRRQSTSFVKSWVAETVLTMTSKAPRRDLYVVGSLVA